MTNPVSQLLAWIKLARKALLTNFIRVRFSQYGEDVVLNELIRKDCNTGIYVDVGCYHPKRFSNTYMLFRRGWRGVNIDLEANKVALFDIARPKDFNVTAAVSDLPVRVQIKKSRDFDLGSSIGQIADHESDGDSVQCRTLDSILDDSPWRGQPIDLLTVDAEKHDLQVLKSLNFGRYQPKIVIVEDHETDVERLLETPTYYFLRDRGYRLKSWTIYSMIFVLPGANLLAEKHRVVV